MKRKLWAAGQEQASNLPTRLHTPLHRSFPIAFHLRDFSAVARNGVIVYWSQDLTQRINNVAILWLTVLLLT